MRDMLPFTYNDEIWQKLPELAADLHNNSQKLVLALMPGIGIKDTYRRDGKEIPYQPYIDGKQMDIFVKDKDGMRIMAVLGFLIEVK